MTSYLPPYSPLLEVESAVVESFVVLTYKLTEKEFLPLLTQVTRQVHHFLTGDFAL